MLTDPILLIGAGGHAKVVFDAMRCACPEAGVIVRDDNPRVADKPFFNLQPRTPVEFMEGEPMLVHVAIGHNETRRALMDRAAASGRHAFTIIHPRSIIAIGVNIGPGTFVAAAAVVAPGAVLGRAAIINHAAIIDHDCQMGDFTHIAPHAVLGGGVRVGAGVLVGAGAVVLPGVCIGDGAIVGAGAVVTRDVEPGDTVVGMPARKHLS